MTVFRALLLLVLALLLSAGSDVARSLATAGDSAQVTEATADCCPPTSGHADDEGGGCDLDCGQDCCVTGVAASAATAARAARLPTGRSHFRVNLPTALVPDRLTGPPPTPPPIG